MMQSLNREEPDEPQLTKITATGIVLKRVAYPLHEGGIRVVCSTDRTFQF